MHRYKNKRRERTRITLHYLPKEPRIQSRSDKWKENDKQLIIRVFRFLFWKFHIK